MVRRRCRLFLLLLALACALGTTWRSRALASPSTSQPRLGPARPTGLRAVGDEDVAILTPEPVPPLPQPVPDLPLPPDLGAFTGATIGVVETVIDANEWHDAVPPIASMRPGDRVSAAIVRRAMAEALETGFFADARVAFEDIEGTVLATLHLVPRRIIDSLRLELHGAPVDGEQLLRDAELVVDGELVASRLADQVRRLEHLLAWRGFPSPIVTLKTERTGDPLRVVLIADIDPGAPRRVERRVVYPFGGPPGAIADIDAHYAIHVGDRADEPALQVADSAMENRVRASGYHRAVVTHDLVLHRGIIVLRVRVDFGTRFETRYEGNDHFDADALDDVLDLANETDRTPSRLVQKLREFYVKRGFLDAEVTVEVRGKPDDRVHYLVFHVAEEERVRVAARAYPCLHESDIKGLRDGPSSASEIGSEIDSYLEEELPGADLFKPARPSGVDDLLGPLPPRGARPDPLELDPNSTYAPETYERAVQHVQELYRSEGFLSAQVGPVQVMRRRCDPSAPPGRCRPVPLTQALKDVCTYDAAGLPRPVPPLEAEFSCVPDRARGVECQSKVVLRIPVKLGPRTQLYDLAFAGAHAIAPKDLARAADLKLGSYVSTVKLEEARRRVTDAYKEEGYAFVDVKYVLESSPDRTRARVRFIISEGEQVLVRQIVLRGNTFTKSDTILGRVRLVVGEPYRTSYVRKTEERIATLGTFASVTVAMDNPYVPQRSKVVVITVNERPRQYTEFAPGFSTGEGFRVAGEYGHRNLWGKAIALTLRLQLAYIPTPFIIDPTARENYRNLNTLARIAVRATGGLVFPDVGLGPLVRAGLDALIVHDLQRDFYITKLAAIPNINYRPVNEVQLTFFSSAELNNSRIFRQGSIDEYITSLALQGVNTTNIVRQLLVPDGMSYVVSQRVLASWDRRDNAFNATRGTYIATGVEHVDGFPIHDKEQTFTTPPQESHFFKLTQTFGGYIPLPKGFRIASLTRLGANVQITSNSATYPDRLFFMGGVDSMRGWNLNSFVPQDYADRIAADADKPDTVVDPQTGQTVPNPAKFTPNTRPIRGGNFMINERIELRIPVKGPFETVLFSDIGNLWIDPTYPFRLNQFPMRVDVGTGVRLQTPVGPLAIDYGINITRKWYENFGAVNFAVGLF